MFSFHVPCSIVGGNARSTVASAPERIVATGELDSWLYFFADGASFYVFRIVGVIWNSLMMKSNMFSSIHDFQIFKSVVSPVTVFVVNNLIRFQRATDFVLSKEDVQFTTRFSELNGQIALSCKINTARTIWAFSNLFGISVSLPSSIVHLAPASFFGRFLASGY
jgi:hypothetical protein